MDYKKIILKNLKTILSKISSIKHKNHWIIIALLAICFFIGTSSYNYFFQVANSQNNQEFTKWSSPDETANYVFAKLYGQTSEIKFFEEYNLYSQDLILPRSCVSTQGEVKPVSFLGIILIYGTIAKLTSYKVIPFLTPFFGAIGIIFFYLFVRRFFGSKNALVSASLLSFFPPFVYYTARSMFHNVLFVVLLMIGFYFGVLMFDKFSSKLKIFANYKNLIFASLSGLFMGLAIITRTSELLWIIPALIVIFIFNFRKIGLLKLLLFLTFLFLAIFPAAYWNQLLYNSPINSGYPQLNNSLRELAYTSSGLLKSATQGNFYYLKNLLSKIVNIIFHFGFDAGKSKAMFYNYFIAMFSWLAVLGSLGLILFFKKIKKYKKKHFIYLAVYFLISLILVFYYGSWEFYDNPDKTSFTIGNSYTRYWLPVYLGIMPFASLVIISFSKKASVFLMSLFLKLKKTSIFKTNNKVEILKKILKNIQKHSFFSKVLWQEKSNKIKIIKNTICVLIILLISFWSVKFVLFGSEEGLVYSLQRNIETKKDYDLVMNLTEHNSVIITQHHDKLFFPERKVIVGLFDNPEINKLYARLVNYLPVYYYNFTFPKNTVDFLNSERFKNINMQIKEVKKINNSFTLYKIEKNETTKKLTK